MSTFLELQDRVLDGSKRDGLSNRTEIKSLVNQTYLELHAIMRLKITNVTKTLTVNVAAYTLSSSFSLTDVQDIRHILITDSVTAQNYVLESVMPDYVLYLQQTQTTSGGSMNYYAFDGLDNLNFYPPPSSTTTQATITYIARPALLVADGDVPANIPVEFHDVIVLGAIARAVRTTYPPLYVQYEAAYKQGQGDLRRWKNRFDSSMPRKAIVKGSRLPGFPHDNSTYYSGMRS